MQPPIELTERLLGQAAGWEALKQARAFLADDRVVSSCWTPPLLKGVVQDGSISYRAGLVIESQVDMENLCSCRPSAQWGTICAHSVAVGLHWLRQASAKSCEENSSGLGPESGARTDLARGHSPLHEASRKRVLRRASISSEGDTLALQVILPPNFKAGFEKDKATVFCEAIWQGKRRPLNSLPASQAFFLSDADARLLDWLESSSGGQLPAMLVLSRRSVADLFEVLIGHPRVTVGKAVHLQFLGEPWRPPIRAAVSSLGEIVLKGAWAESRAAMLPSENRAWVWLGDRMQPVQLPADYLSILQSGELRVPRCRVPQLLKTGWAVLAAATDLKCDFALEDFSFHSIEPQFILSLDGGLAMLHALFQARYAGCIATPGVTNEDATWFPDPQDVRRYFSRNLAAEQNGLSLLRQCGFQGPDDQGRLVLKGQDRVYGFFARQYPQLQRQWEVSLEERLGQSTGRQFDRVAPEFRVVASGEQWFELSIGYKTASGEVISAAEVQRLLQSGQGYKRLANGRVALLDTGAIEELQEVIKDCQPQQQSGFYRISQNQAAYLDATLQQQSGWTWQSQQGWQQRLSQQRGDQKPVPPSLGSLDSILRPYQKEAIAWLLYLRHNGYGGLLADEMGLGKTLQTLALFEAIRTHQAGAAAGSRPDLGCSLVVCPSSLVYNWRAEAARFTPGLRVLTIDGSHRESLFAQVQESDLVVTSYALMRRDAPQYREFEFDTLVLDEAQHIKNRQSQNAQAVKSIRARHRLVLTGTPLENSVLDVWSLFDFLMPGYLGSASDFRERYEMPITRDRNAQVQSRLIRRLRPFVLRRLKQQVAPELPDKLEQVVYCDLTEQQAAAYREVLEASRKQILESASGSDTAKGRMLVFTALLRLRQIACDLRLLKIEAIDPETASGKFDLFLELLQEILDDGHRVLVFSQFVELLRLMRERLDIEGIAYAYLDGSTRDRETEITRFQNTPSLPVFLISLKAGGVGLNLAAADTVIHFDPWWNPAVEQQATDRAHRLGQERVVTSYKLIARGTVEEKILKLQERKRELIGQTLGDEQSLAEVLTWDEIQQLLAS